MNVKQALKAKNKLTTQIKSLYDIAKSHNSIEEGNLRRYSVNGVLNEAEELTKELVDLKVKIHQINIAQKDQMIKDLEYQIEGLQDELDIHNATTSIN